jgi:ABC-type sugar transport system permease subunit
VGFVAVLLTPGLLLYCLLVLWPMEQSFWVALHRWRGVSGSMAFVGLENFARIVRDDRFALALGHNLLFLLMAGISLLVLSLFFANALAQRLKGGEFFRALFLFPNVVSMVAVSTLWMFLYNPNWGLVNALLRGLGLKGLAMTWLADPRTVLPAVTVTYVWYALGFYVLLFRAGIQNIAGEIQEAATIDGATAGQRFRCVTLPLLNPIVRLAVIYLVINSMNLFALVWIMAPPSGTGGATEVVLTYLYQKGFVEQQFGYSTAVGATNFLVVMVITLVIQRVWKVDEG